METTFESSEDESRFLKLKLEEVYSNEDVSHIKELDYAMKTATDKFNDSVNKACLPHGLVKLFPDNSLQCMIESGAKGNMVNQVQMSCMLGQIELEGCRPPLTPSGRTLPSFEPYDCSPRAGGFVDGRFATGIRPQEFFFHTMAGREGLIDTAVKTSRSGYLQRCIIKHLEGVMVNYDSTVRDSDGSIIQFQYGEDGVDIGRSQFLKKDRLHLLANNLPILLDQFSKSPHFNQMDSKKCDKVVKKLKKWRKRRTDQSNQKSYMSPFTVFSSKLQRSSSDEKYEKDKLIEAYRNLDENSQNELAEYACPDPVSAQYWSSTTFGALSEKSRDEFDNFISDRTKLPRYWTEYHESNFRRAFYWKSLV
uniref:DNA-directed RNA polymerase n=1 Tax=Romanomermis culicivorax TaxID=13658 RepID=A0A915KIB6_ROMCU